MVTILIAIAAYILGSITGFILTIIIVAFSATKKERDEKRLKAEIARTIHKKKEQQKNLQTDKWCTDCKEYDKEKHCCPRYNRVIRNTLTELQRKEQKND